MTRQDLFKACASKTSQSLSANVAPSICGQYRAACTSRSAPASELCGANSRKALQSCSVASGDLPRPRMCGTSVVDRDIGRQQ
jgi:hypothetical protein